MFGLIFTTLLVIRVPRFSAQLFRNHPIGLHRKEMSVMRCYAEAASSHWKMIKVGSPMKMSARKLNEKAVG